MIRSLVSFATVDETDLVRKRAEKKEERDQSNRVHVVMSFVGLMTGRMKSWCVPMWEANEEFDSKEHWSRIFRFCYSNNQPTVEINNNPNQKEYQSVEELTSIRSSRMSPSLRYPFLSFSLSLCAFPYNRQARPSDLSFYLQTARIPVVFMVRVVKMTRAYRSDIPKISFLVSVS